MTTDPGAADLGQLFDAHVAAEFVAKDAGATMATMTAAPTVVHVPVLTGGRGTDQLHAFYRDWFIPAWPDDVELEAKAVAVEAGALVRRRQPGQSVRGLEAVLARELDPHG